VAEAGAAPARAQPRRGRQKSWLNNDGHGYEERRLITLSLDPPPLLLRDDHSRPIRGLRFRARESVMDEFLRNR